MMMIGSGDDGDDDDDDDWWLDPVLWLAHLPESSLPGVTAMTWV